MMRNLTSWSLLAVLLLAVLSNVAHAATSADATIFNRATLSYDGGTDVTVGVAVKVGLVGAAPTLSAPTDDSDISGNTVIVPYTIFSNATGRDTYTLSANSVDSGVNAPGTIVFKDSGGTPITSINLGAAITGGTNTVADTILIPAGSEVNLTNGSNIRIGANTYTITGITPGTVKTVTVDEVLTVISLTPVGGAPTIGVGSIAAGVQVGEEKTFTMEVPTGTLTAPPTSGTHTVTVTVTGNKTPPAAPLDTQDTVVITVTEVVVAMAKSVALIDTGGAACAASNGTPGAFVFFPTVLNADSGACVLYQITVAPAAGQPALTNAIVTDAMPEHAIYVADSLTLNGVFYNTITTVSDGGVLPLASGTFRVNSPNSGINDGSGNDGTGELGVVDSGATATITFRAVIGE